MQKKEKETKEIIKIMKSNWVRAAIILLQESSNLPIDSKMTTLMKLKPRAASSLTRTYRNSPSINYSNINLTIPTK